LIYDRHKINPGFIISDIVDSNKNQYVDLVQEGGGVLGIALLGYTHVLEESGVRFFDLAGTSAGSINTMLLASLGNINEKKTDKILKYLKDQNLFDFVDGNKRIKKLIQRLVDENYQGIIWKVICNFFRIKRYITDNLGLNPGNAFENWLKVILNENGISNTADLENLRNDLPHLKNIENNPVKYEKARTAIITAEVTTKSKVQFPQMAHLYWPDVNSIHPAKFIRASMSIPFFFEPLEVRNIPNRGLTNVSEWYESVRYKG
jgi:NTE family protein